MGLVEEGGEKVERSVPYQAIPKPSTLKRRLRVVTSASVVYWAWADGSWERSLGR
jgi:hypothetical protein